MRPIALLLTACLLTAAPPVAAQSGSEAQVDGRLDALFGEHERHRAFLAALKQAVRANDAQRVAAMVEYPLTVYGAAQQETVYKGPAELLRSYDKVFTPGVRAAVLAQDYADLFVRDQGVMIGNGEIWFAGVCGDPECATIERISIKAVNLP